MTEVRQIVRIINADVPGEKQIRMGLTCVTGVGHSFSAAICNQLRLDNSRKVGTLSNEEIKKIEDVIKNPQNHKIPPFMFNRKKDPESGQDRHLNSADLKLSKEFDIKKFKKIKSYKGIRHALGLPVRGQKTRSNFRKGKAVGVSKKKSAPAKKGESKPEKK